MSRQNIELVRRLLDRWNAGDVEGWLDCWHPDGQWDSVPFEAFQGSPATYRGHAGLRRFAADVLEGFAGLGRIEPTRFVDVDDSVLVLGEYRNKGRAGGADIAARMAWLLELRHGLVARGRDFLHQEEALQAVGLSGHEAEHD